MKLLVLFLYHEDPKYNELRDAQRRYCHVYDNIDCYFYCFSNITERIKIVDDTIYIRGNEAYLNITLKTIKAMQYLLKSNNYSYVLRTNVSTFCNFPLIYNRLLQLPTRGVYTGAKINTVKYIDKMSGIYDDRYMGIKYVHGTCIIFSSDVARFVIANIHKIDMTVIDDVAFALLLKHYDSTLNVYGKHYISNINNNPTNELLQYHFVRTVHCHQETQVDLLKRLAGAI